MQILRKFGMGTQRGREHSGTAAWDKHIPVGKASSGSSNPHQLLKQADIIFLRHVLKDIAEIEVINAALVGAAEEILQGGAPTFEPVEIRANGLKVLGAQSVGQGGGMVACEDPLDIGVLGRIDPDEPLANTVEETISDAPLDVLEKAWIASFAP